MPKRSTWSPPADGLYRYFTRKETPMLKTETVPAKIEMTPEEAHRRFGEPCNNCKRWVNGVWCAMKHRQKDVALTTSHMDTWTVRKQGGCSDHALKVGVWWHEDPIKPHQSGYGGSPTSILI